MTISFEAAAEEFHLHYFDWCIQQAHAAATENFERVKAIHGYYAGVFQEFIEECGTGEGLKLCLALLKKVHLGVLQKRGESLSQSEKFIIDKFKQFARSGGSVMRIPKVIRGRWPKEPEIQQQDRLTINDIRIALSSCVSRYLGQPVIQHARGLLEFRHDINGWVIFTNITAEEDNEYWSIRYSQTISSRPDLDAEVIGTSISYLAWLGLPTTQWDSVVRGDLAPIASMIAELAQLFLSAAPRLLAEITNPTKIC